MNMLHVRLKKVKSVTILQMAMPSLNRVREKYRPKRI
jgi:hypothetical protein